MSKYVENLVKANLKSEEPYETLANIADKELAVVIARKEADIALLEKTMSDTKSEYPLNVDNILKTSAQIAEAKAELKSLEELRKELF